MILARLFVLVGGLIVLVLTAALVVPYFVDWTSYRADFEREASAVLGRKVTVQGAATARLLPFPSVTFSDVAVGGGPDGKAAMTIETFSMDAELAPFMSGELHIFDMRIVRPKGIIDVTNDGRVDWIARTAAPFDVGRVSLEKLTITEGRIEIRHALSGRTHVLSEINAVVSARALSGPWRFDGSLRVDGGRMALNGTTGAVEDAGKMRLKLRAEPALYPVAVEADGSVAIRDGGLVYDGDFRIDPKVPAPATGAAKPAAAADADPGNRLKGAFSVDNKRLALEDVRFETGPVADPYTADGSAAIDFGAEPRFSISAKGAQIRFDDTVSGEAGAMLSLPQRITALETALQDLPVPTMPGSIDVNLPAVVVGDTTIRDVRLMAEPGEGGWTLKSGAATLPGRTTLEASGFVATGDEFRFAGSLLLAVAQPSGFAAWLSKDIDEAIRRLPAAGFSAKVDLTARRQSFSDLELVLGDAKFHGEIDSSQPENVRPSVLLKLDGDALDVDGLSAFASIFVSDKGVTRFADTDVDFQVKAGPVTVAGLSADTLDTALRLRNGDLEVDRLSIGGLVGASVSATGRIRDFPENPTGNVDASVVAVDLAPLLRLAASLAPDTSILRQIASRWTAQAGLLADSKIDFVVSAAANDDDTTGFAVSLQGMTGGTAISATLSGNGKVPAPLDARIALSVSARNPDATALIALAGLPALPLGLVGGGEVNVSLEGVPSKNLVSRISLKGDDFLIGFDGTTSVGVQGPTAKGKAKLEADDIETWMITTGLVLPAMGSGRPVSLAADADFANGLLALHSLTGTIDDNAIAGDINASLKDGKPHITGQMALDSLDLEPLAIMVLGEGTTIGDDKSWASTPFNPEPVLPVTADVTVSADTLSAGAATSAYDATMALKLDEQGLRATDVKAKFLGGDLVGALELTNTAGTGLISAQMQVRGADLDLMLPAAGLHGATDTSATLSSSGKSVDAMVAALSGSGTATLRGLRIDGLNSAALAPLLSRADGIGRDIDAARTAGFAPEIVADGSFESAGTDLAFTVAGGVLRAPSISLANPQAVLSADVRGDLSSGTVQADGTIAYQAGDDAQAGSEPALRFTIEGPFGEAKRTFDSEPLAQFLTQRALEREQARVEALQAALLERQRLRREVRYYAALETERARIAEEKRKAEEAARLKAEEEARVKAEEEARLRAEQEEQLRIQALEQQKAAEAARLEAEVQAKAAEAARLEAEAKAKAEAQAKADAEAEKAAAETARAAKAAEAEAEKQARDEARRSTDQAARDAAKPAPATARPKPTIDPAAQEDLTRRKLEPYGIDNFLKSLQGQ